MKPFLLSIAKKTGYVLAAFIILAAILVGVSRLTMPVLDTHRADVEKWASQLLATPVTIDKVRVSWYLYQPEISLKHLTILNKDSHEPILQMQKVSIFFSIPQSLWQRKLVPSAIMISGADLNVHQAASGEISVQGFPSIGGFNSQPFKSETRFTDIMAWLSQQPRLILRDIDLRYTKFTGQKNFVTLYNLSFENSTSQHTILGKAILHQDIPTEMNFSVRWLGDMTNLATIKAKAYVYVSGLSLSQWMKDFSWQGWRVNEGIASAKIWATWTNRSFHRVQSTFQLYRLDLHSETDKSTHKIQRLSGNIGWKREGNGQVIAGDDILVDLPQHLWPATSFYVSLSPKISTGMTVKAATLGYIDLSDIQPFLFSSPVFLPADMRKMISDLQIKGALQNASATFAGPWTDWQHMSLNANFTQLGFAAWHQLPHVSNLSGMLKWNGKEGDLSLNSDRVSIQYDPLFLQPINIDQLSGDLQWTRAKNNSWVLHIPSLQLANDDVSANLSGSLTIPPKRSPIADLIANFTLQNATHITRYLPMRTYDKELVVWLQNAFLSGEVNSGHAMLRGPLNDFPFDNNTGTFAISGVVNNIDFHYAPDWPLMRRVNGKLSFTGRQMIVDIDKAEIMNIPLANIHGVIPYFGSNKPQILHVQSENIQTDFTHVLNFIHASPLEKTIGKIFNGIEMQGPLILKIGLMMPLKNPDKTQVQSAINLKDTTLNLVPWNLILTNLNGQLQVTEGSVNAKKIQGNLFNKPFQFSLTTVKKPKNIALVQANFATNLGMTDLENWLKLSFSQIATGSADVNGEINLSLKAPLELQLHSKLIGIAVNLPDQYGKKAGVARDFSATVIAQEKQPLRMKLSYGNLFSAALTMDRKAEKFNLVGANLRLGSGSVNWPATSGLYITGNFDNLDWDKIRLYLSQSGNNQLPAIALRALDINANHIHLGAQSLSDVHIQVTPAEDNWDIDITSPDVVGKIEVPMSFTPHEWIDAKFQRLRFHSTTQTTKVSPPINVKSLPAIAFIANDVSYNDIPLGQITFKTAPNANGLIIRALNIVSPRINLQAVGDWIQNGNNYTTRLRGEATTSQLSDLLDSFGLDVHNFIASKGRLTFSLNWRDAPYIPELSSLNGHATLDLGKGRIVDVGEGNGAKMDLGRMLSIFSLQTIPRRLTLDFSDLFQRGYSFDSVRGDFNFNDGDVYTNNMLIDGPIGKVGINGRIGLNEKDYDFNLSITPYVTSSIPIAATLLSAGNPLVGAAAFAVSSLIGSQVSKVVTYYYVVTGPWNNPSWKLVNSPTTEK